MNPGTFQNQDGFVALISIVIITAILLVMGFSLSTGGFFLRFNVLDSESKKSSLALAEACTQQAMLNLAITPTYAPAAGGDLVPVGASSCRICQINPVGGNPKTIDTRAVHQDGASNSYSNVRAVVTQDAFGNFTVISWHDLNSNPNPSCGVP